MYDVRSVFALHTQYLQPSKTRCHNPAAYPDRIYPLLSAFTDQSWGSGLKMRNQDLDASLALVEISSKAACCPRHHNKNEKRSFEGTGTLNARIRWWFQNIILLAKHDAWINLGRPYVLLVISCFNPPFL